MLQYESKTLSKSLVQYLPDTAVQDGSRIALWHMRCTHLSTRNLITIENAHQLLVYMLLLCCFEMLFTELLQYGYHACRQVWHPARHHTAAGGCCLAFSAPHIDSAAPRSKLLTQQLYNTIHEAEKTHQTPSMSSAMRNLACNRRTSVRCPRQLRLTLSTGNMLNTFNAMHQVCCSCRGHRQLTHM